MIATRSGRFTLLSLSLLLTGCQTPEARVDAPEPGSSGSLTPSTLGTLGATEEIRTFRFVYGATINELEPGAEARIWLPVAQTTHDQSVTRGAISVPGDYRLTRESVFGNALLYVEAVADEQGEIPLEIAYHVERRAARFNHDQPPAGHERSLFLKPTTMVPVDGSILAALTGDKTPTGDRLAMTRTLYDAVLDRMRYDKPPGEPWGRGDARWACEAGLGNCTDFHSLFIAACRDLGIPARFEIGFSVPPERGQGPVGGYHCWAMFQHEDRWFPVDISEADKNPEMREYYFGRLTADRVTFSTGRDLRLAPEQDAGPVNFLVYPYVEVDGRPHTSFVKRFRYEDIR
jgi:transglutaminase-like putative cysteine protease